jgi:hypothetical protein
MTRVIAGLLLACALLLAACGDDDETEITATPGMTTPAATATPTATAGEISWEEAKGLLAECRVASVMQTHALDIYLVLDDGTEVHTTEPGIDDIFLEIDGLDEGCRPQSIATE